MIESDFVGYPNTAMKDKGVISWTSPSNIALIKYWGKFDNQIPANPSLSFTLDSCSTTTILEYQKKSDTSNYSFEVYLDGEKKEDFEPKIRTFFQRIESYISFLKEYHFIIKTSNSFPHSSGIASSASGMSALALCLMSIEKENTPEMTNSFFITKASFLARLGSGSASRSLEGPLVVWGQHQAIEGSSNLFGTKYPLLIHENFKNYRDTILLVDKGQKEVSSTVGHNLMNNHPYASKRFEQAHENLQKMISILEKGDLKAFCQVVENEALTLHAMMLSSDPSFILMKPNTLEIIERIKHFRMETGIPICFTLDAGANVHMLYPDRDAQRVEQFITSDLVVYCQNGHYICDRIGFGAKQLPI